MVAFLCLSAVCCAPMVLKGPTKAETDASASAIADCALANWPRYDDAISSADVVARALASSCASLIQADARLRAGPFPELIPRFVQRGMTGEMLIPLVLSYRTRAQELGRMQ